MALLPTKTVPEKNPKVPVLVSYAYMRKLPEETLKFIFNHPRVEILLDCGAFTALNTGKEISLGEYMDFLNAWKTKLFGYIALDKLGDPKVTDTNLQKMLKGGLKPIPVHVRGDNATRMNELFGYSSWVAFGGLRRPHVGPADIAYIKQKMLWAKGRNVHWLGYTNLPQIVSFKPFSCDTSSAAEARMYGRCSFYNGNGYFQSRTFDEFRTQPVSMLMHTIAAECGCCVDDLHEEKNWHGSESKSSLITFYSHLKYVTDARKKIGTRIFIASIPATIGMLYYGIDIMHKTLYCGKNRELEPAGVC